MRAGILPPSGCRARAAAEPASPLCSAIRTQPFRPPGVNSASDPIPPDGVREELAPRAQFYWPRIARLFAPGGTPARTVVEEFDFDAYIACPVSSSKYSACRALAHQRQH